MSIDCKKPEKCSFSSQAGRIGCLIDPSGSLELVPVPSKLERMSDFLDNKNHKPHGASV
jgi:hypothetical protein